MKQYHIFYVGTYIYLYKSVRKRFRSTHFKLKKWFHLAGAGIEGLDIQGTGSRIQQQMLRHLANFKMSLTLIVFFSSSSFSPFSILTSRFFVSCQGKKRNSAFLLKVDWSCDHAIGIIWKLWFSLFTFSLFTHSLIPKFRYSIPHTFLGS